MVILKQKRENMGITQNDLAQKMGVKHNTISQWEAGVRSPKVKDLPKLAEILDCTTDELLGITKKP